MRTRSKFKPATFFKSSTFHLPLRRSSANSSGYLETSSRPRGVLCEERRRETINMPFCLIILLREKSREITIDWSANKRLTSLKIVHRRSMIIECWHELSLKHHYAQIIWISKYNTRFFGDYYIKAVVNSNFYRVIYDILVDAIEIPADPDMVHANQVSNVIYVLRHIRYGGLSSAFHEVVVKRDHHQSAVGSLKTSTRWCKMERRIP